MMSLIELRKKPFAALLFAFLASATMPACSSDEEEAPPPDETGSAADCENAATLDEKERCIQDLGI